MLKKLKNNREGFTIIEVMIVLAIAGLILLIVFLAIPALQRASRNTSRKSDAGHISSAVNDYISNTNGVLPGYATWGVATTGACAVILNDAGTLSQYNAANNFGCGASAYTTAGGTLNDFDIANKNITPSAAMTGQSMILDEDAVCPTTPGGSTTTGVTVRQAALLYTVETNTGPWTWDCIQSE
jgi:prepilin-type N-terminal cleavage/methylation domain-containing protein